MSVWRRLQRVGKKAAKFQITASLHELNIECSRQYSPGSLVVVWSRRSRRYSSKSFEPVKSSDNSNSFKYVWSMPENVEFVTTLYRNEKAIQFEEKEWICQIEDVGSKSAGLFSGSTPSTRRRVLAARQIDLAEFTSDLPVQTNLKVVMRLASKKLISATVLLTLNSVIVKAGEATDEDMISVASLMSLSRTGSFNVGSGVTINDLGGVAAFSPTIPRLADKDDLNSHSFSNSSFHTDLSELTAKLQALERRQIDSFVESPIKANGNVSDHTSELDNSKTSLNRSQNQDSLPPACGDVLAKPLIPSSGKTLPQSSEFKPISTQSQSDLLLWCQSVTKSYENVQIIDLTSSFQNGLAFCAILHYFFPDRIDYDSLSSEDPLQNCRLAFDVASKLGVPRVLDPSEVVSKSRSPDLLSMMTYLHQIRTLCCEQTKKNGENSACTNENSPLNGMIEQCFIKTNSSSETNHSLQKIENVTDENSNNAENNLTSPDKASRSPSKKKIPLTNYEHMLAKARSLLQQSRQNYLAPTSRPSALPPLAHPRKPYPRSGSLTGIHSVNENFNRNPTTDESLMNNRSEGKTDQLIEAKLYTSSSVNDSSNALPSASNYISNEQAELEEAQRELDKEAAALEPQLRQQMAYRPGTALEEQLLRRWFILVNKKNALIHRGFQLSIMEKEDDLKKKMKMLQDELRSVLAVEDYLKTDNDRRREDLLLQDLVRLVNERDDIIQELDLHEKALAEELELEQNASFQSYGRRRIDKSCVLQ
ncbi:unnamed protein product [Schistosoma turkestanicum]|nr:unnamed protein product [Schistosoma turkestanicum]